MPRILMKIQELEAVTSWQSHQCPSWDGDAKKLGELCHLCQKVSKLGHYSVDSGRMILVV
jgi:hypothetical protein